MEMKRMILASFAEAISELKSREEAVGVHTSTNSQQGSVEITPLFKDDKEANFEDRRSFGSGLREGMPTVAQPARLSLAKQKVKKQRAKMAKASKRVNRNK